MAFAGNYRRNVRRPPAGRVQAYAALTAMLGSLIILRGGPPAEATALRYRILHRFRGKPGDGSLPNGRPVRVGSKFYGLSEQGGLDDRGTIFSLAPSGAERLVYSFRGGKNDAAAPFGALLYWHDKLYGVSLAGGPYRDALGGGTIFSFNMKTRHERVLHFFSGGAQDGWRPFCGLITEGGWLFGTTPKGGAAGLGIVYRIHPSGSGFKVLYSFAGKKGHDGARPVGRLCRVGRVFYGVTGRGGAWNDGAIFRVNVDGRNERILHQFKGGYAGRSRADSANPNSGLVFDDGYLYGTSRAGGNSGDGTIFRVATAGRGERAVYSFAGGPRDGDGPCYADRLIMSHGILYGTTVLGGRHNARGVPCGVVFAFNIKDLRASVLHFFAGGELGARPVGGLALWRGRLYGLASGGHKGRGLAYSISR